MLKNRNLYYAGVSLYIISLLLILPPKLNNTYPYIVFLFGVSIIIGLFKLLTRKIEVNKYLNSKNFFNYSDNELLVLMLIIIFTSTFIYSGYIHYVILSKGVLVQSPLNPIEYMDKGDKYFISESDYTAINFWSKASWVLFIPTFIIMIIERYFRDRRLK
jgi:hypothetical protein